MFISLRPLGPLALLPCLAVFPSASLGCNKSQGDTSTTNPAPAPSAPAANTAKPAVTGATATVPTTPTTAAKAYESRGTVKAFGEGRKTVKIAHEEIPGYMKAMTMPFAVGSTNSLDGLKEGDLVDFSFAEQSDGRLLIQSIKKR